MEPVNLAAPVHNAVSITVTIILLLLWAYFILFF